MFTKILLCADGSDEALQATRMAAQLAGRFKAEIVLINVLDMMGLASPYCFAPEAAPPTDAILECAEEMQESAIQVTEKTLTELGVPFHTRKEAGQPIYTITTVAEEEKADLIVMGSRGLSGWQTFVLGSVSEGVAHHAHCPVLLVRGNRACLNRILLASDGSAGADKAAHVALDLAKAYEARLEALNVIDLRALPHRHSHAPVESETARLINPDAMARHMEKVAGESEIEVTLSQKVGHPAEVIVQVAEASDVDLIVLGSRGLGGFQRLLLGSVCDSVLHHAHRSVLVVR